MYKAQIIKELLNYVYLHNDLPKIYNDAEKLNVLNELIENRIIHTSDVTTSYIPVNPNVKMDDKKSQKYIVDKDAANRMYGVQVPS